ncbi:MAG: PorV/PorQ family protein [Endomicrobiales bacterium]|nr:PorV/PorQ family protein [Endomicrobiales bacterium]
MKNLRFLIILMIVCATLAAHRVFGAGEPGKFLSWGAGARSLGLANSFVGIADDVYAVYWNPAALGVLQHKEVGAFHAMLWEDTAYSFMGYAHPMLNKGTFAGSFLRLYSGGAEKRDEYNVQIGSFDDQQLAVTLAYGTNVYRKLHWGMSAKYLNHTLDTFSQNGFTVDSGMYYPVNNSLSLGANVQNIIAGYFSETDDKLPLVVRLGSGYKILGDRLLIAVDVGRKLGYGPALDFYSVGFETKFYEMISFRLGRNADEITTGFGINYKQMTFDYAMALHYLGPSHRVSMNVKFGKSLDEILMAEQPRLLETLAAATTAAALTPEEQAMRKEMQVKFRETYQAAVELYKKGYYTQSYDKFTIAQKIDPSDTNVPIYQERLKLVVPIVPQNTATDKASELMRRGLIYFMEGNNENAVKTIAYALSVEPENFSISRLLSRIEEKTGIKAEYTKPVSGMSLVDQKLYECLIAFRQKDYAQVIALCEEVLVLEPRNVLAYKRLGSAFFALGDKNKAIDAWRRALRIQPDDNLRNMIREIQQQK